MPQAINTFIPDFEYALDKAKRNTGGLNQSGTLIEQGDFPVNVADLQRRDTMDMEMRAEYPEMYASESGYIQAKNSGGSIEEGVAFERTMFSDTIRKNSDY